MNGFWGGRSERVFVDVRVSVQFALLLITPIRYPHVAKNMEISKKKEHADSVSKKLNMPRLHLWL